MPDFKPGQIVQLNDGRKATVRFAGQTSFQVGEWIGVELEDKTGKNDGSVQGQRYFDCPMGYGMFVKPMMATIVAQPPTAVKPGVKKAARPSSFINPAANRVSIGNDATLNRRKSLNAPSPSPVSRTTRPASIGRLPGSASPTKSPTKPLSGASSAAASRTGTPSNARVSSAGARTRTAVPAQRTSMGPPAAPASRTTRQASVSSVASRGSISHTRSASGRAPGLAGLRRSDSGRRPSADSQAGYEGNAGSRSGETAPNSPVKSDAEILSPQPKSPVLAKTNNLEKLAAASSAAQKPATPVGMPRSVSGGLLNKEVEDLKAKLKVLERKRQEDRDKLKQLDKVQGERDKFSDIIQKLQSKYQPQQQELIELRKQLKEAEVRFDSVEALQADHDTALELATLDREMAEENYEVLKVELEAVQQKAEELELEVEILREENAEYSKGMTPDEKTSANWMQMERTNERLREALIRLRDITHEQEEDLKAQIAVLEEDVRDFGNTKEEHEKTKEKLQQSEAAVDDLRSQLDTALGAEDMIEDLTERNMSLSEQMEELKAVIEDLESLKEINDELEINHVQNEKELQEELDFRDSVIAEQVRRAAQQEENFEDMEYTLSRFRELVTNLQTDLDDMRASQAVTEGESEKLNDRSRAMMDLNMKLQISAAKAQVKTIDLEMRRLEAQEAEQHLEIVKLFLPDTYKEEQDSVLALLRFRRLAFKSNLLSGFIKEKLNGQPQPGHEDDLFAGCDVVDKLTWVATMCDRFFNDMSHCSMTQFGNYRNALLEVEPVERALNGWIDSLRKDELKEKQCAEVLQRTIALMSHLGEVHLADDAPAYADESHMKAVVVQSHLESAAISFNATRVMVERATSVDGADEEMTQLLAKKFETVITQTRSTKVIAGKAVRALEDLKTRSLSLPPETRDLFESCQTAGEGIAVLSRRIGTALHTLFTQDEGRTDPFTHSDVQNAIHAAVLEVTFCSESDMFSQYLLQLRNLQALVSEAVGLATDLSQTREFDVSPAPWKLRSQELKALKAVPIDAEEELRRLKEEHGEARRTIAQRDEHLSTAALKIETLESRMRDAQTNVERIHALQQDLEASTEQAASLKDDIEKQDRELKMLESERDKWKKVASDSRAYADGAGAAGNKAGQERAVATAREMDALKNEIESLQSAVRYLREDNRRARLTEQQNYDWLAEPLKKPTSAAEQRKALVIAEGKDALSELVKMTSSAGIFNYGSIPKDRLAWRSAKTTPQYHAAKQTEDFAAWKSWQDSVARKSESIALPALGVAVDGSRLRPVARLQIRLPGPDGKMLKSGTRSRVQIVGSREWDVLQSARVAAV
ncbi:dynactin [Cordyceps fumosorosea ARSEF 2679]|uniref:Dynactin n=1 Tax=Cordyceps fumosorosea (strain ARSEF 2679) TaxID=1081104 RepID=A0A167SBE8_CORFA|nr:dynactin [Cordyceps fumosorosea ARSEF 2679]OAA59451.1 dynactin [Cordyceps fumosorosea ARSEF 2679]